MDTSAVNDRRPHQRAMAWRVILLVLLSLTVGGLGYSYFLLQAQQVQLNSQQDQIASLQSENNTLKAGVDSQALISGRDFVNESELGQKAMNAFEAMAANDDLIRGGDYDYRIEYMDESFARVQVDYYQAVDSNVKRSLSEEGSIFYFKRVADEEVTSPGVEAWTLIAIDPTEDQKLALQDRYGITEAVFNEDRPA